MFGYSLSNWLEVIRYGLFVGALFCAIVVVSNKISIKMLRK